MQWCQRLKEIKQNQKNTMKLNIFRRATVITTIGLAVLLGISEVGNAQRNRDEQRQQEKVEKQRQHDEKEQQKISGKR